MGEKVTIPVEVDVDVVRRFQQDCAKEAAGYEALATDHPHPGSRLHIGDIARAAVLRFDLPWEPSEQDVTAYLESRDLPDTAMWRGIAREVYAKARSLGWDAVPRRIEGTTNDG